MTQVNQNRVTISFTSSICDHFRPRTLIPHLHHFPSLCVWYCFLVFSLSLSISILKTIYFSVNFEVKLSFTSHFTSPFDRSDCSSFKTIATTSLFFLLPLGIFLRVTPLLPVEKYFHYYHKFGTKVYALDASANFCLVKYLQRKYDSRCLLFWCRTGVRARKNNVKSPALHVCFAHLIKSDHYALLLCTCNIIH